MRKIKNPPTIHDREKIHRAFGIKKWMHNRLAGAKSRGGAVLPKKYSEVIDAFCASIGYFDNDKLKKLNELERKELFVSKRFPKFCSFALKYEFKEEEVLVEGQTPEAEMVPV